MVRETQRGLPNQEKQPITVRISNWYCNLSNLKQVIYFSILLPAIVGFIFAGFGFLLTEHYKEYNYEKEIAQGILMDFQSIEPRLNNYVQTWNTTYTSTFTPIYPESGAYYLYGKDIYKLGPDLASLLDICYKNLNYAESERKLWVSMYMDKDYYFETPLEKSNSDKLSKEIAIKINNCVILIPNIKTLLNEKTNSTFFSV